MKVSALVSADLSTELAGWDGVCNSLAEIRAGHEEFDQFFTEVFDELDTLSCNLVRQQEKSQNGRRRAEQELNQQAAQLDQQRTALAAELERLQEITGLQGEAESPDVVDSNRFEQLQKEANQDRVSLRAAIESARAQAAQLTQVVGELGEMRSELCETRQEILRHHEELDAERSAASPEGPDEDLPSQFRQIQEERRLLEQERAVLEVELESVRNRAAEMSETLTEQKRQTAEQRDAWTREFRQMRHVLESLKGQLTSDRQDDSVPLPKTDSTPEAVRTAPDHGAAAGDAVLDSVMAQFQMLQKDRARQREKVGESN